MGQRDGVYASVLAAAELNWYRRVATTDSPIGSVWNDNAVTTNSQVVTLFFFFAHCMLLTMIKVKIRLEIPEPTMGAGIPTRLRNQRWRCSRTDH